MQMSKKGDAGVGEELGGDNFFLPWVKIIWYFPEKKNLLVFLMD